MLTPPPSSGDPSANHCDRKPLLSALSYISDDILNICCPSIVIQGHVISRQDDAKAASARCTGDNGART